MQGVYEWQQLNGWPGMETVFLVPGRAIRRDISKGHPFPKGDLQRTQLTECLGSALATAKEEELFIEARRS